jgi:hypothetical protein
MLAGRGVFKVTGGASATTFDHQGCVIQIGEERMNIYDTTGLSHQDRQSTLSKETLEKLSDLIRKLGEINLLVFVMRFRITEEALETYQFLRDIFDGEGPPIVVAITGREFETNHEDWWKENQKSFTAFGVVFDGHSIGTAKEQFSSDRSFVEMRENLLWLIHGHCVGPTTPVKINQSTRDVANLGKVFDTARAKVRASMGGSANVKALAFNDVGSKRQKKPNIVMRLIWFLRTKVMRKVQVRLGCQDA